MNDNKNFGLDGYNSGFFNLVWYVIGIDIFEVIIEFFDLGILLF